MTLPAVAVDTIAANYEGGNALFEMASREFVETKAKQAVARIQTRWGARVQDRLDAGTLPLDTYEAVVAESVLRVVRNPDGLRMEQEGNYQYGRFANVANGLLMFTDDNVEDLTGVKPGRGFVGTARIGRMGST